MNEKSADTLAPVVQTLHWLAQVKFTGEFPITMQNGAPHFARMELSCKTEELGGLVQRLGSSSTEARAKAHRGLLDTVENALRELMRDKFFGRVIVTMRDGEPGLFHVHRTYQVKQLRNHRQNAA